jgi:hypothetical protein
MKNSQGARIRLAMPPESTKLLNIDPKGYAVDLPGRTAKFGQPVRHVVAFYDKGGAQLEKLGIAVAPNRAERKFADINPIKSGYQWKIALPDCRKVSEGFGGKMAMDEVGLD